MTDVIEVQNRINFRNIAIFFIISIAGVINGMRDFSIYKIGISKFVFPDPSTYHNVVEMNESMVNMTANSMSFMGTAGMIIMVIFVAVIIMSMSCGMLGRGD